MYVCPVCVCLMSKCEVSSFCQCPQCGIIISASAAQELYEAKKRLFENKEFDELGLS